MLIQNNIVDMKKKQVLTGNKSTSYKCLHATQLNVQQALEMGHIETL